MNFVKFQNIYKSHRARLFSWLLRGSAGSWGKNTTIHPPFHSNNLKEFFIGDNCSIHAGGWIDCIPSYAGEDYSPHIEIGDNTYIGHRVHIIACGTMKIGKHVMMADGVYISDNLHGFEDIDVPVANQPLKHPGPVTIEDEVLEEGLNIVTLKELLGHAEITTTMIYLHVAQCKHIHPHSPLDTLYHRRRPCVRV